MDKMSVHGSVFSVYWIYYQSQKIPTFLVCNSFVSTILESSPPTFFPVSFLLLEKTFGRQRDGVPNKVLLSFLFQKKRKPFFKAKPLGLAYFVTVLGLIDKYLEQRPESYRYGCCFCFCCCCSRCFSGREVWRGKAVEAVECLQTFFWRLKFEKPCDFLCRQKSVGVSKHQRTLFRRLFLSRIS